MRGRAARVDDALRDALVVEVGDLLAEDEILQQRQSARGVALSESWLSDSGTPWLVVRVAC